MPFLSEIDGLRLLYKEIIEGFSPYPTSSCYIKHLDELESLEILRKKQDLFEIYKKEGVPTQEQKLKDAIASGEWDEGKEDQILTYKYNISDNEKNLKSLIPQQHPPIKKIISEIKQKLNALLKEKDSVLGQTADYFAERDSFNYTIYLSLYKDPLSRLFNSYHDFQEIEDEGVVSYGKILENALTKFTHNNLTYIAVMPFFLNPLSYVKENVFNFLRKPIIEMTNYQSALISLGLRNLNILSNTDAEPPALLDDVPLNDIVKWYDMHFSVMLGKSKSNSK